MRTPPVGHRHLGSERGTTFVLAAITLVTLMGLAAFAVDRGIVWMSRGQAQTAADAGALAGAVSRAYEEKDNPPVAGGKASTSALTLALGNDVWGTPGSANVSWDCPPGVIGLCSRVDVYRDDEHNNPLPIVLSRILGITSQGVRATATAVVQTANSTECLRPFAIPDKWTEASVPPSPDYYNHWNGNVELTPHDIYTGDGGYVLPDDKGTYIQLKMDSHSSQIRESWFQLLQLPDGSGGYDTGGSNIRQNIKGCSGNATTLGDYLPMEMGNKVGPVKQGIDDLIGRDPGAHFDSSTNTVVGSCAPSSTCGAYSPRIIPIAVYDTELMNYSMSGPGNFNYCPGNQPCIKIAKILSFFIADTSDDKDVYGWLVAMPGELLGSAPTPSQSFLQTIRLVR